MGSSHGLRLKIIEYMHSSAAGGHFGIDVTYHRILGVFWWPGLKTEVNKFV